MKITLDKITARLNELRSHDGFRRYFANMSWLLVENTLRLIAGLLVGIYVARYLGPDQYGLLSYALAFTAIFSAVSDLGLETIAIRELVNYPEKTVDFVGTVFWLKVFGAFLMLGLIGIAVQFTSNDSTTNLYIFIISFGIIFNSFQVIDFYFQSKVLSKYVSICKMIQLTVSSLIKLCLVFLKSDLFWFIIVIFFDYVSLAVFLLYAYRHQKIESFFRHFNPALAKNLLHDSWPQILAGITVMIYLRFDQIILKEMLGEAEVGLYSAAVKLAEIWYVIPAIVANSLFPSIINSRKNPQLYDNRLQRIYTLMVWMAIGVALPMSIFSKWLVTFLYGPAFAPAAGVLRIYIWGGVFVYLSAAFGKYLVTENVTKKNFYRVLLGAASNIPLNYFLIKSYGMSGSAVASLISLFLANYAYDFFDKDLHHQLKLKTLAFLNPTLIFK